MHARRLIEEQPERLRAALEARRYEFDLDVLLARMASRKELRYVEITGPSVLTAENIVRWR